MMVAPPYGMDVSSRLWWADRQLAAAGSVVDVHKRMEAFELAAISAGHDVKTARSMAEERYGEDLKAARMRRDEMRIQEKEWWERLEKEAAQTKRPWWQFWP